ncbi:Y+L amino acid transporter 2 isoform X1 [Manduca sexta]|nr:Y+L amino acid transporter 2 isoform X1 [Manduca sexta]
MVGKIAAPAIAARFARRSPKSKEAECESVTLKSDLDADVESKDGGGALEAKMSLLNGCTVIVGSIIGSGIFVSPTGVLKYTGSVNASLIVWITSGIFSMIGAYCYAELGTMIRQSGADYAYIMETFGPFAAFIRLWIECMIVRPCSQAIVALTFSVYVLRPVFPECEPPNEATRLLAACCILLLTFVNCWSVRAATRVQDWFTYAKLLALFIIIAAGAYQLCMGKVEHFTFEGTTDSVTSIALSFYSGLFAYNGWNYLNFIIEELKDPVRNLPRAIAISCALVTIVYTFTNIAFYTTLSPTEVLGSAAVAVTFAERLFGWFALSIPLFVAASTFGAVNGVLLTSSRLFYAGAAQGQMPAMLTMVTTRATPAPAVLAVALLSLLYLTVSDIYALINYVGFATWLSIGAAVFCLPVLRYTRPNLERPIKVNLFFPIVYIICTVLVVAVPALASPAETGVGCLMILTAVPVYLLLLHPRTKMNCLEAVMHRATYLVQKLTMAVRPKVK